MMTDARRGRFDVVLVWASDRIARSVKHFLEVLDELNRSDVAYATLQAEHRLGAFQPYSSDSTRPAIGGQLYHA